MEIQLLLVIIQAFCILTSVQATNPDNVINKEGGDRIDGDAVIDVGNSLANPLVKFIGKALKNLEGEMKTKLKEVLCRLQSCLEWSEWTECIHKIDNYGIQNRTRTCGQLQDDGSCFYPENTENKTEYESRLCEIQMGNDSKPQGCLTNYTMTEHGFCIKLTKVSRSWYDAQSHCENDGGNLINIDSKEKSQDIAKTYASLALNTIVFIGGSRSSSGSDWEVKSGAKNSFSNWQSGEPNENRHFPVCRYAQKTHATEEWKWYDWFSCTTKGSYYMCEIGK